MRKVGHLAVEDGSGTKTGHRKDDNWLLTGVRTLVYSRPKLVQNDKTKVWGLVRIVRTPEGKYGRSDVGC